MTTPFPMIERAVQELVETKYPAAEGKVGGSLSYEDGDDLYVYLTLLPGGGGATQTEGEWVLDIEVFAPTYVAAMEASLDLEAALVGPRHVTSTLRIDNCYQNEGPAERPWDSEASARVGAIYGFTARRPG